MTLSKLRGITWSSETDFLLLQIGIFLGASTGVLNPIGNKTRHIRYKLADATLVELENIDGIISFACFHHLQPHQRENFISKTHSELKKGGYFFVYDYFISDYKEEKERKLSCLKLITHEMADLILHNGKDNSIKVMIDILNNHIFLNGEYMLTQKQFRSLVAPYFKTVVKNKIWGKGDSYGAYIYALRKSSK